MTPEDTTWAPVRNDLCAHILPDGNNQGSAAPIKIGNRAPSAQIRDTLSDKHGHWLSSGKPIGRSPIDRGADSLTREMLDFAGITLKALVSHVRAERPSRPAVIAAPKTLSVLPPEMRPDVYATVLMTEATPWSTSRKTNISKLCAAGSDGSH